MPGIIIGIYCTARNVGTWMLQFKHLLSVPFFFIMNKYMTEHVVFNVNAWNYHWNLNLIYTPKQVLLLLLEYAVLPGTLGHGCFSLNIFFLFLFFYHGNISRNHQHNDTYLNLVLLYICRT